MPVTKVPLLLFSGGLDSTSMLHQFLDKGNVETLYVEGGQCSAKVEQEKAARKKIIAKLEALTGNKVIDHIVKMPAIFTGDTPDHAWIQPMTWLTGALQVSDGNRHSGLYIGYVAGDGVLAHLHDITQAWHHIQRFTKQNSIPIEFPLYLYSKIRLMQDIHPALWDDIWVCELPKVVFSPKEVVPCDKCHPCDERAANLFLFERRTGKTLEQHLADRSKILDLQSQTDPYLPGMEEFEKEPVEISESPSLLGILKNLQ